MFEKIDHVEVVCGDMERSIKFYTEVLGFKLKRRKDASKPPLKEIAFLELGGSTIEIFSVENPAAPSTGTWQLGLRRIALGVKDIDGALEYFKARGVTAVSDKRVLDIASLFVIQDPDGLQVEIVQWH